MSTAGTVACVHRTQGPGKVTADEEKTHGRLSQLVNVGSLPHSHPSERRPSAVMLMPPSVFPSVPPRPLGGDSLCQREFSGRGDVLGLFAGPAAVPGVLPSMAPRSQERGWGGQFPAPAPLLDNCEARSLSPPTPPVPQTRAGHKGTDCARHPFLVPFPTHPQPLRRTRIKHRAKFSAVHSWGHGCQSGAVCQQE